MGKFIRLDRKGEWKGKEHRSSFAGTAITLEGKGKGGELND